MSDDNELSDDELIVVDEQADTEVELNAIEQNLIDELYAVIETAATQRTTLADVQPPTSIIQHAAEAAASVIMAFERGYRMSDGGEA